jgi:hypothetical protein
MKIAFFTEHAFEAGKFPRNFNNARTDVAWMIALDASNYSFTSNPYHHDLGIIIVPKKNPMSAMQFYIEKRNCCGKWAVMQEGPHWYWQDHDIPTQLEYFQLLSNVDIIFCHNEFDRLYYLGLFPEKRVEILPALMIEEAIPSNIGTKENRTGTIIGGNWVSWYSGQDSYVIAREFGEKIYAPSMGRKQQDEQYLEDIEYYPYLNWSNWIAELSKRKYAVHLMRTFAAGTFALNCAYLGIPCIGYANLDTQRICFPKLSVDLGDLSEARKIAIHLLENQLFYNHVSEYARTAFRKNYIESIFIENFYNNLKGV